MDRARRDTANDWDLDWQTKRRQDSSQPFFSLPHFHQAPRYFRQGSGPFMQRLAHAVIRPLVTRKDSGGHTFTWSGLLGSTAASGLSNAYYPASDRGIESTFTRVRWGIPFSVIDHVIDEFGPDLERRFLQMKPKLSAEPQQNVIPRS
jgi:hypothetical protein